MIRTSILGLACLSIGALASAASAAVVFSDNFESGSMSNWTTTSTTPNPLTITTARNVVPAGGTYSAAIDTSADRMHHNIIADNGGSEVSGAFSFTTWIYDPVIGGTTSTRVYNEIRDYVGGSGLPNGGTTASGSLGQLLAIGKYNQVTTTGEVFASTKYQARIVSGPAAVIGWFNLNGAGSPNRSVGWHSFTIEREATTGTLNFYVDSILSRTVTGVGITAMDTLVIGPGIGTTATDSNVDGVLLTVPEPASLAGLAVVGAILRRRRA